jgi:hypothetical protein
LGPNLNQTIQPSKFQKEFFSYLEKLANVCKVFAINVNFLDDLSLGYSIQIQK